MCAPWLGAIIFGASGSASWRTESVKAPVALTTTLAFGVNVSPVSTSCQVTPLTMPSRPCAAGDLGVVEQRRALLGRGGDQVDEQPRVVELAVVINHAAGESLRD
jgi:hypothetical protein